jgi:hypothetical protein
LLSVVTALFLLAPDARAEPATNSKRQVIGVIVLPAEDADAADARSIKRGIMEAFKGDSSEALVDPFRLMSSRPRNITEETKEYLDRGLAALQEGRYHEAIVPLKSALQKMHDSLAQVPKVQLADAICHLAAAYLGAGRMAPAQQTLQWLLAWRPRHSLQLRVGNPIDWTETVHRMRDWQAKAPLGSVQITSEPSRAELFIDGRRMGPTPIFVSNLTVGTHYLTLRLEGYQRVVRSIQVQLREQTLQVQLLPQQDVFSLLQQLREVQSYMGDPEVEFPPVLQSQMGLTHALFVVVSAPQPQQDLSAYLYRLGGGSVVAQTTLTLTPPIRPVQLDPLALWRAKIAQGPLRWDMGPPAESQPWYKRWWVWGLVTVGVAAAVVVPWVLVNRSDNASSEAYQVTW